MTPAERAAKAVTVTPYTFKLFGQDETWWFVSALGERVDTCVFQEEAETAAQPRRAELAAIVTEAERELRTRIAAALLAEADRIDTAAECLKCFDTRAVLVSRAGGLRLAAKMAGECE